MSLAVLADHMASKGRGPDSMLIHMSPTEVQGLQALAMAHGGSLTINPETGLPEAGFLDKLLPTILGAGLTFMGVPPNVSAMIVGGIQTVRTGDLGKGISAGLGAYGGANLTSNMMTAGSSALGADANMLAAQQATELSGLESMSSAFGGAGATAGADAVGQAAAANQAASSAVGAASDYEKLSRGFGSTVDQFKNNPMQALKTNAKDLAMAFGPAIFSEMGVKKNLPQTVTGMIRPYSFDPYSGTYTSGNPYQVRPTYGAEGGLMGMDDGGYGPGMLDFTQKSEPVVRMAEGGLGSVVRMATGGPPTVMADKDLFTQTGDWNKAAALRDEQVNALNAYNWQQQADARDQAARASNITADANRLRAAVAPPPAPVDYNALATNFVNTAAANPNITTSDFITGANTANIGLTQPLATALDKSGLSLGAQYALTHANIGDAGNVEETYGGLKGLSSNINYSLAAYNADPANKNKTAKQKQDDALAALGKYNLNEADVKRATGRSLSQLFPTELVCGPGFKKSIDGLTCVPDTTVITQETQCPSGQHYDPVLKACVPNVDATQTTTTNVTTPTSISTAAASSLPVGISGAGVTTINPNGTVTTRPDIPGIPEGGFTGMKNLRDVYEEGGGSLGYTSPTYASLKAMEEKYPLRGAAKQSYDYLMGREDYSPIPYTKDGQISKSYNESVMKLPKASASKMYIFQNGKFVPNPDYAIPTYDKDGKKSLNLTNADVRTFMDKNPSTDAFYTWATTNNLSPEQIALASGRPINEISKLFTGAKDLVGDDGKIDQTKVDAKTDEDFKTNFDHVAYLKANPDVQAELDAGKANFGNKDDLAAAAYAHYERYGKAQKRPLKAAGGLLAGGGLAAMARGGMSGQFDLGGYSDGGRLLRGPGDGVSDSIPATIGNKRPARLADGEFVVPARIVSELGNGSTEAGARKLYAMMDRVQAARRSTVGKGRVAKNSRSDKYLPA